MVIHIENFGIEFCSYAYLRECFYIINKKFNDVSFQLNTRLTAVNSVLAQSY